MRIIRPADILLPRVRSMGSWSVVACDQFTSQPDYWEEAEKLAGRIRNGDASVDAVYTDIKKDYHGSRILANRILAGEERLAQENEAKATDAAQRHRQALQPEPAPAPAALNH